MRLHIAFDDLPMARWGALFHVLCLEHPGATLEFTPVAFPTRGSSRLEGVDVGLFVNPPRERGLERLVLERSPMVVLMAAGYRLAREHDELRVADLLDEPFLVGPPLDPAWTAFWTLDDFRQGPPKLSGGVVREAREGLDAVAAGQAVATCPASMAAGLSHPGVVALPLVDGPLVETALVWRAAKRYPLVDALIDLAAAMTSLGSGVDADDGSATKPARGQALKGGEERPHCSTGTDAIQEIKGKSVARPVDSVDSRTEALQPGKLRATRRL